MTIHKKTSFETKWGIRADEIAARDGTTVPAIHMRVFKFGTPWQRKKKATYFEKKYSKTMWEMACEFDVHPLTIAYLDKKFGNAYLGNGKPHKNRGKQRAKVHWKDVNRYKSLPWLSPEHPDYDAWRSGELFPEESVFPRELARKDKYYL